MIKPIKDYVLVQAYEPENSAGGIQLLSPIDDDGAKKGTVIAVGDGIRSKSGNLIPMDVSVGDIVYYEDNDQPGREEVIDGAKKIERFESNGRFEERDSSENPRNTKEN